MSLHAVRPGEWPTGEYAGWPAIYRDALELFGFLEAIYGDAPLLRASLRYLNRIAVPVGSELSDWFTIGFTAPAFLQDTFAMNLRQTWARMEGNDDLSATVGLAMIEIPDAALQQDHVGFLLDIEVFNLWQKMAPTFQAIPAWCRRAHDVEGDIFEQSITPALRDRFEVIR